MKKGVLNKYTIMGSITLAMGAITSALFGLYIGKIVDVISQESMQGFTKVLFQTTILLLLNVLFSIIGWSNAYASSCNKVTFIKNRVYKNELLKARTENIDISKFSSKIDLLFNDYFMDRWNIYDSTLVFLFSSIAIIYINWIMFIVTIVVSILPIFIPMLFNQRVQTVTKEFTDESKNYLHSVEDMLHGRLEIIKYGVKKSYLGKHRNHNSYYEKKRYKSKVVNNRVQSLTELMGNATFILVFLAGGILSSKGLMKVGGIIGVIQLMNNVVRPIILVSQLMTEMNACKPVLRELMEEVDDSIDKNDICLPMQNGIELSAKNLIYHYPNSERLLLHNMNYTFLEGKKYLIQGESGIGKSTFAKLLSGELIPTEGTVEINGTSLLQFAPDIRNKMVQYIDQKCYLFDDTMLNNITLYREIAKEKLSNCIHQLGLETLKLDQFIDDDNGISGGQKSRICLARALVELPKILIVDEPTASLDSENTQLIINYLCSLPCTVIVISHNYSEEVVSRFDEIIKI